MAAEEPNPAIQINMFKFLSSLHQDVCGYSFVAAKGAFCLILCQIEENKVFWGHLPAIQALRGNYICRSQVVRTTPDVEQTRNTRGNERSRVCKMFNIGTCTKDESHFNNRIMYKHHCNFCSQNGLKYSHTEIECKKKHNSKVNSKGDGCLLKNKHKNV